MKLTKTEPLFAKGDKVVVGEEGIRPWAGMVRTKPKWSDDTGWWYDVADVTNIERRVHETRLEKFLG